MYSFVKFGLFDHSFLISANVISRSSDISKYSREALGLRDNESRLYNYTLFSATNASSCI